MPTAQFVQAGASIDFTPVADVAAGDVVVQGDLLGVVHRPIPAGEPGALVVEGVFDFPKATDVAYEVGTVLFWDVAAGIVTTTGGANKQAGKVVRAAATTDPTVRVRLSAQATPGTLVYANTAASAPVTNTNVETAFDESTSIPAHSLQAGDVVKVRVLVYVSAFAGGTSLTVRVKAAGALLGDHQLLSVELGAGTVIPFDLAVVIRAAGASGSFYASGLILYGETVFNGPTAIDTTAAIPITVTAQWGAANPGHSCRLETLVVEKLTR